MEANLAKGEFQQCPKCGYGDPNAAECSNKLVYNRGHDKIEVYCPRCGYLIDKLEPLSKEEWAVAK